MAVNYRINIVYDYQQLNNTNERIGQQNTGKPLTKNDFQLTTSFYNTIISE